jgi:hypothetical protein
LLRNLRRGRVPERGETPPPDRPDTDVVLTGLKPIDVVCAGMYRACSTWQYEVVAHLLESHHGGRRLGYLTCEQYAELLHGDSGARNAPEGAAWRVLKSHEGDRTFARALRAGSARAVYAYRDVREVAFSMMHKRSMSFEQLLRQGIIHQILANDRFWTRQPGVLVQRYEDLLADPVSGVLALAHHLGIELAYGAAARIAEEYSQESNRARTEALKQRLHHAGIDLESTANVQICDATTLLHWNHMRPGNASWRDQASPRQVDHLHRLCGRWLEARGYLEPFGAPAASAERRGSLGEVARGQLDLMAARTNFLARAASLRFPRAARGLKRVLGIRADGQVGATPWGEKSGADSPLAAKSRPPARDAVESAHAR